MGKFLPCIKRLSCNIINLKYYSPENFRTKILQAAAFQSTSHFHAPFLKTWNVTSLESTEISPSLKINYI
jgi:hypothetical protein